MKRRGIVVAGCATIIVVVAAGWYWGSPWWTLHRMREAARVGDAEVLARYVDYAGMHARDRSAAPHYWSLPPDAAPAETPDGRRLREWLQRMRAEALSAPPMGFADIAPWLSQMPIRVGGFGAPGPDGYRPVIDRRSFNEFRVVDERSPDNGRLTFRRRGGGWRLEEVQFAQQ
jgi:hypothetical protein